MSKSAHAAEVWARLERFLIERCGLPDGRMLERDRPELIRAIGAELQGRVSDQMLTPRKPPRKPAQTEQAQPAQFRIADWRTNDTIIDAHWARLLDRACSPRMGYDPDDEVTYGSRG